MVKLDAQSDKYYLSTIAQRYCKRADIGNYQLFHQKITYKPCDFVYTILIGSTILNTLRYLRNIIQTQFSIIINRTKTP